jgi:hypothetical protein
LNIAGPVMTQEVPPLEAAMRERLLQQFAPMAKAFADLTGVWVDPWQPPD